MTDEDSSLTPDKTEGPPSMSPPEELIFTADDPCPGCDAAKEELDEPGQRLVTFSERLREIQGRSRQIDTSSTPATILGLRVVIDELLTLAMERPEIWGGPREGWATRDRPANWVVASCDDISACVRGYLSSTDLELTSEIEAQLRKARRLLAALIETIFQSAVSLSISRGIEPVNDAKSPGKVVPGYEVNDRGEGEVS